MLTLDVTVTIPLVGPGWFWIGWIAGLLASAIGHALRAVWRESR